MYSIATSGRNEREAAEGTVIDTEQRYWIEVGIQLNNIK